jgi:hypothetical protein
MANADPPWVDDKKGWKDQPVPRFIARLQETAISPGAVFRFRLTAEEELVMTISPESDDVWNHVIVTIAFVSVEDGFDFSGPYEWVIKWPMPLLPIRFQFLHMLIVACLDSATFQEIRAAEEVTLIQRGGMKS